jgi:hypothetical protein
MTTPKRKRKTAEADPLDADFGPGLTEERLGEDPAAAPRPGSGPIPGIACAGEGCLLKPAADLVTRFSLSLAGRHGPSLSRAAFSGIELMKALRDFLDEEIALVERAAGKSEGARPRYEKIRVE